MTNGCNWNAVSAFANCGLAKADEHVARAEDEIGALGNARHPHACFAHLGAGRFQPLVQDSERARIDVDRHSKRLGDTVGGDVIRGRIPPVVKTYV